MMKPPKSIKKEIRIKIENCPILIKQTINNKTVPNRNLNIS